MQPAAKLEVRSASGQLLFVVTVSESDVTHPDVTQIETGGNNGHGKPHIGPQLLHQGDGTKPQPSQIPIPTNGDTPMSDSQKRLMFRLLADQGIGGEKAHEHLKQQFRVKSLKEVTKSEASREIEKLLSEAKGGKPFHAAV